MKNYVLKKWYKGRDHRMFAYPDDIDEELVPMLDVFNNIPGVRTEYCCTGHGGSGWYMTFKCTSQFMVDTIVGYFTGSTTINQEEEKDWMDRVQTKLTFEVNDNGMCCFDPIPEHDIVIYCNPLGKMPAAKRRKEYMKICEYFATFTPRALWKSVQEFDYKEDLKNEKKDNR